MHPSSVPLLCALLPFLAVHLSLVISIYQGNVPACFPYIEGCTTISRAARSGDAIFLFRALMLPTAAILVVYWLLAFAWLRALEQKVTRGMKTMRALGVIGAVFLVLYATYLGSEGDFYRWMRRYGVTIFFSFTALAQIFLTRRLYQLEKTNALPGQRPLIHAKMLFCIFQWGIGLISLVLGVIITGKEPRYIMQNIVEWNFAIAMNANFFITYLLFKRTQLRVHVNVNN